MHIIVSSLLTFLILMFYLVQPMDDTVTNNKYEVLQHLKYKYLAHMRLEGRLSTADENELRAALNSIGCVIDSDPETYIRATSKESLSQPRILRSNDVTGSELSLEIKCRLEHEVNKPRTLIGGASNVQYFKVGGKGLSERVDP